MKIKTNAKSVIDSLAALEESYEQNGASLECAIEVTDGDWGGLAANVRVSPFAAIHLARQLLQIVDKNFDGAHFQIDKASIAPESKDQLIFSLRTGGS